MTRHHQYKPKPAYTAKQIMAYAVLAIIVGFIFAASYGAAV